MASHNDTGKEGEDLATSWLEQAGYHILHRNWRYSYYEIDIIASRNGFIHFVEVKCRNYSPVGLPEASVTRKKFKWLQRAADQYLFLNPGDGWIQFNILAITKHRDESVEYFFIEDVFL